MESLPQVVSLKKHFLIVSLVRSLPVLLDAGVIPDFAIMVDASDHTEARLNLIPDTPVLAEYLYLLLTTRILLHWRQTFQNLFLCPRPSSLVAIYIKRFTVIRPHLTWGGVATFAVAAFAELEVRSITLVGQDLSVSDRTYASEDQSSIYNDELGHLHCLGINGEQLTTQPDFIAFIREFSQLSSRYAHKVQLINATAHGAFLEGWEHMPLNIEHPAVVSVADKEEEASTASMQVLGQNSLVEGRKEACMEALTSEIKLVNEIEALARLLVNELERLINVGGIDVNELEALEEQLSAIMQAIGTLMVFYTSAAKLDVDADLSSVASLQENYIVSLDYYKNIEMSARRLSPLLTAR